MQLKNTNDNYGAVAKTFHWVIALIIIGMIPFGWYMGDLEASPEKFRFYALHKSIGITVLALVASRLLWRLWMGAPQALKTHKAWEIRLAKTVHVLLYILMFLMPLSGWMMSSAAGFPVSVFGLFTMPNILNKNQELL